jgi:hypothetical protein
VDSGARGRPSLALRAAPPGPAGPGVPDVRPGLRARAAGALQLPVAGGRLPGLPRVRADAGHRLGQGHPRCVAEHLRGRAAPVERALQRVGARAARPLREVEPHPARRSLGEAASRAARGGARGRGHLPRRPLPGAPRVVPLDGVPHLQDARSSAAQPVPRVHAVHRLRRRPAERGRTPLPGRRARPRRLAPAGGCRRAPPPRGARHLHRPG